MAIQQKYSPNDCGHFGCNHVLSNCNATFYLESFTSAGLQSNGKIKYTAVLSGKWEFTPSIVWSARNNFSNTMSISGKSKSFDIYKGCNTGCPSGQGTCCNCSGITYYTGNKTFTFELSPTTSSVTASWVFNGNTPVTITYNIPASMRVQPPSGFSATFPSTLSGSTSMSVTGKGNITNTTFYLKTQDTNGNVINTKSTTTTGSSATLSSGATFGANGRYRFQAYASNTAGSTSTSTSGWYYTAPPCPTVSITSCVYNPSTHKCNLKFSYSKPADNGYYSETLSYVVTDNEGRNYGSGTLATVTGGSAETGTLTLTNIETAAHVTVKVTNTTSAGSCNKSASVYSPVADAAFIGFTWDDVRRKCTIQATAPGAKQTRVSAGYSPNNYNIGTKLTVGEYGDLVVKDLKHGNGEVLYLEAMPEARDNHQYKDEVAKISIPVPNPILGVYTPSCEDIANGAQQKYIVDIIEKKKGASTCTPRWQTGDRVVKIAKCNPDQPGHDAMPECNECGPGQDCIN